MTRQGCLPPFLLPLSSPPSPSPLATLPSERGGLGSGEGEPGQGRGVAREKEGAPDQGTGGGALRGQTGWEFSLRQPPGQAQKTLLLVSVSAEQHQGGALCLVWQALRETPCGHELVWQTAQTSGSEGLGFEFWP